MHGGQLAGHGQNAPILLHQSRKWNFFSISIYATLLHFFFFYWRYKSHMEKILHTTWLILSHVSFSRTKKKLWDFTNFAHSHPISNVCIYLFNMFKLYLYIYIYILFILFSSPNLSLSLSYDYLSSFSFIFTSLVLKPPH